MNTTENKPQTANIDEAIQTVAARVKAEYSVSLEEGEPIRLYVDGLCENPGAMHVGLFARQGDQCLFAEHMFVGHGTCNEAEYLALKCGLRILQEVYPQPTLAIPAAITGADIKNVAPLVEKFRSSTDEISAFFSAKLPNAVKQAPASTEPGPELDAFKGRLTAEFNAIIHGQPIYNVPMLSGIILRPATQQFLDQNPQGMALARLNRLVLEDAYPAEIQPKAPVQTFSDSQLVTKQIAGLWHTKDKMQSYCVFLRKMRKTYLYDLTKISRDENQIADSLAQKYIQKNSGRSLSIDHGRFSPTKQVPPAVKQNDLYNAVVPKETTEFIKQHNLRPKLLRLIQLVKAGEHDEAIAAARQLEADAQMILESAPKTNEMLNKWLRNTIDIVGQSVRMIIDAIESGDEGEVEYVAQELARDEGTGSEIYESQTEMARNGFNPLQDAEQADGEEEI